MQSRTLKAFNDICDMLPLPEDYVPDHAKDGNLYMQFVRDTGLAGTMSVANMSRVWRAGYPKGKLNEPLPIHLERGCHRVELLLSEAASVSQETPHLMCRKSVREELAEDFSQFRALACSIELRAYINGMCKSEIPLLGRTIVCSIDEALRKKESADMHFIRKEFDDAKKAYSEALAMILGLKIDALEHTLLLNRSAVFLKMNNLEDVVVDCTAGLAIDENSVKCRQRRAAVYERLGKKRDALNDYLKMPLSDDTDAVIVRLRKELNIQPPPPPVPPTPDTKSDVGEGGEGRFAGTGKQSGGDSGAGGGGESEESGQNLPKTSKKDEAGVDTPSKSTAASSGAPTASVKRSTASTSSSQPLTALPASSSSSSEPGSTCLPAPLQLPVGAAESTGSLKKPRCEFSLDTLKSLKTITNAFLTGGAGLL